MGFFFSRQTISVLSKCNLYLFVYVFFTTREDVETQISELTEAKNGMTDYDLDYRSLSAYAKIPTKVG